MDKIKNSENVTDLSSEMKKLVSFKKDKNKTKEYIEKEVKKLQKQIESFELWMKYLLEEENEIDEKIEELKKYDDFKKIQSSTSEKVNDSLK